MDELPVDRAARVTRILGLERPVMLRLMEMGLVPGARIEVRSRAPFRGPLQLRVEGYLLSIRHAEALRLEVEGLPDEAASPVPMAKTRTAA